MGRGGRCASPCIPRKLVATLGPTATLYYLEPGMHRASPCIPQKLVATLGPTVTVYNLEPGMHRGLDAFVRTHSLPSDVTTCMYFGVLEGVVQFQWGLSAFSLYHDVMCAACILQVASHSHLSVADL